MNPILHGITSDSAYRGLLDALRNQRGPTAVFGLPEPARAPVLAALYETAGASPRPTVHSLVYITPTEREAARIHEELLAYVPEAQLFLPRDLPLTHVAAVSAERRAARLSTLSRLALSIPTLFVTCAAALPERLAPKDAFLAMQQSARLGQTQDPRALLAQLIAAGYERVALVEGRGQCAMRGDILDIFPPQESLPVRLEFFGDEIDQIRSFDPQTQRAVAVSDAVLLPPAFETPQPREAIDRALAALGEAEGFAFQREAWEQGLPSVGADVLLPLLYAKTDSLFSYLPDETFLLCAEPQRVLDEAATAATLFLETVASMLERGEGHPAQAELLGDGSDIAPALGGKTAAALYSLFRASPAFSHPTQVRFDAHAAPQHLGDLTALANEAHRSKAHGDAVVIYAGEAAGRIRDLFAMEDVPHGWAETLTRPPVRGEILVLGQNLPCGFVFPETRLTVLTQAELFYKKFTKPTAKKTGGTRVADLTPGDFVVHEAHGIGRFVGIEQVTALGASRDYLLLAYRGTDKLYIPTDQLSRVQKYIGGGEGVEPQLSKLGGGEWQSRVNRARGAAKKLAVDLSALYAARAGRQSFPFSSDNDWQRELEARFPYEETPDQKQAIIDVKADMESPRPMDRLLCGDVGYGKTEVALRAVFKAVQDSKQAAFLVPTTILAQQHFNTLTERFSDFPIRIGLLSRFLSPKEREEVAGKLKTGALDLVIGTHALLGKHIHFKDLGLLIIDEEHRFGVNHKERIKALRETVDVLTLTATPIPRTLNLSMTGIRDISLMETPPPKRYPVQTFVTEYNDALLVTALRRELGRGGQAFVVSNRVQGMELTLARLKKLVPEARIDMAHGQMHERQLEKAMLGFLGRETDVLLTSTIIESGVDIPNANTLIVLEADKMGLAQLYQLRGRVGRGDRLGYAYFTVQEARVLSEQANKRLQAIREFTQFGAGFALAMRDLEIRGAGSLLGAEQHGHIADIGYDYYVKLMREAVREAKGEEEIAPVESTLDIETDAYLPREIFGSELLRLAMYKRIAGIDGQESYDDLLCEFIDRYGDPPDPALALMLGALVRALAGRARMAEVRVRPGLVKLTYDASAQPDGGKLLAILARDANLRLLATDPPAIEIHTAEQNALEILKKLPQYLHSFISCDMENYPV
ncbi:MAG: transcription-repair coupling factor [Clostridiales bacterium]|nr:transcription-repair coupling factor [Clostridiales bacterium]